MTLEQQAPPRRRSRREEILEIAVRLFAERGYHGVSMDDIGAAAGVTGPALYHHFAGKEAMIAAALAPVSEGLLGGGRERITRHPGDPAAALTALVEFHVDFALANPAVIALHLHELDRLPEEPRREIRTARRLGIRTVAVHTDVDATLPFVREADEAVPIGPAGAYRDSDAILAAAKSTGAEAVHPGYGFLAENADFARTVTSAGLVWVGPGVDAIAAMGNKVNARNVMAAAGVPVAPGTTDPAADAPAAAAAAEAIGYPVMVKAAAGGGGMGMAVAADEAALRTEYEKVRAFAVRMFGDGSVLIERYFPRVRHVEVQILGLADGRVVALGERECSVQRRNQKVAEESPSPAVTPSLRASLLAAAVRAGEAVGYRNAGTVEFLLDPATGEFFFLEMNTRLQVEHPVTDCVHGVDLVEEQLRVASGLAPTFGASVPAPSRHAVVRLVDGQADRVRAGPRGGAGPRARSGRRVRGGRAKVQPAVLRRAAGEPPVRVRRLRHGPRGTDAMTARWPERVSIREVGPRDGLQNEAPVPTGAKVALLDALSATGVRRIEAVSFVHPKAIPQMADADEVWAAAQRAAGVRYSALVPNSRGARRALDAGFREIEVVVSASDTHNRHNVNRSTEESLDDITGLIDLLHDAGASVEVVVATSFGCPYEGDVPPARVSSIVDRVGADGVDRAAFGDTTGMDTPRRVAEEVAPVRERHPELPLLLHFHNTRGTALANILMAMELGVTEYDASVGGLGGCPYAPGASGNVATEEVVHMLHDMGIDTGIDLDALIGAARLAEEIVGRELPSGVLRAGPRLAR